MRRWHPLGPLTLDSYRFGSGITELYIKPVSNAPPAILDVDYDALATG
jgi:hypothetical protein